MEFKEPLGKSRLIKSLKGLATTKLRPHLYALGAGAFGGCDAVFLSRVVSMTSRGVGFAERVACVLKTRNRTYRAVTQNWRPRSGRALWKRRSAERGCLGSGSGQSKGNCNQHAVVNRVHTSFRTSRPARVQLASAGTVLHQPISRMQVPRLRAAAGRARPGLDVRT